ELDPQKLQSGAYSVAYIGRMLADPASEYESVDPTERCGVAANHLLDLVAENAERFVGSRIRPNGVEKLSHVGARFRDSQQPTATAQRLGDVLVRQPVKTVAHHARGGERSLQAEESGDGRQSAVESGVEAGDLWKRWRYARNLIDGAQLGRQMIGRQRNHVIE